MNGRSRRAERTTPLLDSDGSPVGSPHGVASAESAAIPIRAAGSEVDALASTLAPPGRGGWQGSLWGTAFNMCSAILGAGALSLPHAVSAMGLVPALVLLLLTAAATHYSVVLLVSVIVATGTRSFEELTRQVFGRLNGRLVELSIVVFQFGTLVAYTVAIGDILHPLVSMPAVQSRMPWCGASRKSSPNPDFDSILLKLTPAPALAPTRILISTRPQPQLRFEPKLSQPTPD
jgi:hypothetical protein